MKKTLKKGISLLAAGVLLTTSAAAYAAQLPEEGAAPLSVSSSSQVELKTEITMESYTLTADRLAFTLYANPTIGQFRRTEFTVTVQKENGVGTSNFVPVGEGYFKQSGPKNFYLDEALSIQPGERVIIYVSASGEAFDGYNYVGTAYGSNEFTLTY